MKKFALTLLTAFLVASSWIGVTTAQSSSSQPAPGLMPRGIVTTPGQYFAGDRDTGFYWIGANDFGITAFGTLVARFNTSGVVLPNNNSALRWTDSVGTSRRVAVLTSGDDIFLGDVDNVLPAGSDTLVIGGDTIQFLTNGANAARIQLDGTLSVGTTADAAGALNVSGAIFHAGTQAYWLKGETLFTSGSGTYTVPSGVRAIRVRLVGGGGGGGYARAQTTSGARAGAAPGTAGDCVEAWMTGLSASYSYGVGAAGSGGVAAGPTNATAGGDTTFATFTAKGGSAGTSRTVTTAAINLMGLTVAAAKSANAGATLNIQGDAGVVAFVDGADTNYTSIGGTSCLGGQSRIATAGTGASGLAQVGGAGDAYGGGGSGAFAARAGANVEANGGAGAAGVVIIEEYF